MKNTVMIKSNSVFKFVLKKGEFSRGNYLNIHTIQNNKNSQNNEFGVCVSKKNGNSVQRNKIKRWIRDIYKQEESKLKQNIYLIILVKKTIKFDDLDYYKIKEDMINQFNKLGLYE